MYEDAFTKMKRAAGVSSIEEVVKRYKLYHTLTSSERNLH